MANQKVKTKPLNKERFKEARKLRGVTLAMLAAHPDVDRSEKTLLRWIQREEMPIDILDAVSYVLDVDPEYISGTYDRNAEMIESDSEALATLKSSLHAEDFPYVYRKRRDLKPMQYVRDLLIENNIDPGELDKLPLKEQILLFLELDRATRSVLNKHFNLHSSAVHNYSIPMPPEDEIIQM